MGAAVPGFTHTVVLLGGGMCVCERAVQYLHEHIFGKWGHFGYLC